MNDNDKVEFHQKKKHFTVFYFKINNFNLLKYHCLQHTKKYQKRKQKRERESQEFDKMQKKE